MAISRYCARCMSTFDGDPGVCPNLGCGGGRPEEGWGKLLGRGDLVDRRYRVEHPLAVGGAGITYLTREVDDAGQTQGPLLAVKVLYQARASGPFLRRLSTEAQILQELAHPNIVELRGFVHRAGNEPYLVTRFEEGGNLSQHVDRHGPLPPRVAAGILRQVLLALDTAHQRGVVHRDLKPDNVLLRAHALRTTIPEVRVADFGIAKVTSGGMNTNLTRAGAFVGTPEYAAPEQFLGQTPTPATDVFACGALFYFLLTARPPFLFSVRSDVDHSLTELLEQLPVHLPPVRDASADEQLVLQTTLDVMLRERPEERSTIHRALQVLHPLLDVGPPASGTLEITGRPAIDRRARPSVPEPPAVPLPPDAPSSITDAPAPRLPSRSGNTEPIADRAALLRAAEEDEDTVRPAATTAWFDTSPDVPPPPPADVPPPLPVADVIPPPPPMADVIPPPPPVEVLSPPPVDVLPPPPVDVLPPPPVDVLPPPPLPPCDVEDPTVRMDAATGVPVLGTPVPSHEPPALESVLPTLTDSPRAGPVEDAVVRATGVAAGLLVASATPTIEPEAGAAPLETGPLPAPAPIPPPPPPAPEAAPPAAFPPTPLARGETPAPPPFRPTTEFSPLPVRPVPAPPPAPIEGGSRTGVVAAAGAAGCMGLSLVSTGALVLIGLVVVGVLVVVAAVVINPPTAPVTGPIEVPRDEPAERFERASSLPPAGVAKVQRQLEEAAPRIADACGHPARVRAEVLVVPSGQVLFAKVDERGLGQVTPQCVKRNLERVRLETPPQREGIARVELNL